MALQGTIESSSDDSRKGDVPREGGTSLKRAFLEHLQTGGRWVGGGCVVMADDLRGWFNSAVAL